jgi:hypothetical protein
MAAGAPAEPVLQCAPPPAGCGRVLDPSEITSWREYQITGCCASCVRTAQAGRQREAEADGFDGHGVSGHEL